MFISVKEKEARFQAVRQKMAEQKLDALIARGSSAVRGDGAAFRFLTDFPNINIPLVLIFLGRGGGKTDSACGVAVPGDEGAKVCLGRRHQAEH